MASIEVLNATQANVEAPVEIQLSLGNPTYRGPAGKDGKPGKNGYTPIKGVDYFTEADIQSIVEQVTPPEIDLSDYAHKNEIPTKISDLTNDEGFISSYTETDPTVPAWAKQPDKPTYTANEVGALPADTVIPTVPTNVSDFVNDAGYLTQHQSLNDYATKNYVEQVVAGIETGALKRAVVATLPSSGIDENTIYMVERTNSETNNVYDEYLYLNNNWEKIGSTEVDLTDYATKTYVDKQSIPILVLDFARAEATGDSTGYNYKILRKTTNAYAQFLLNEFDYAAAHLTIGAESSIGHYNGIFCWGMIFKTNNTFQIKRLTSVSYANWQNQPWRYTLTWDINETELKIQISYENAAQNYYAGQGLALNGNTFSSTTEYLTNSDILAIWNGENN